MVSQECPGGHLMPHCCCYRWKVVEQPSWVSASISIASEGVRGVGAQSCVTKNAILVQRYSLIYLTLQILWACLIASVWTNTLWGDWEEDPVCKQMGGECDSAALRTHGIIRWGVLNHNWSTLEPEISTGLKLFCSCWSDGPASGV